MNNQIFNIHDLVFSITIIECYIFILLHAITLDKSKIDHWLFLALTLCIGISSTSKLILWNEDITLTHTTSMGIVCLLAASLSLKGPLLFLYVRSLMQQKYKLNLFHLVHALPTIIYFIIIFVSSLTLKHLRLETEDPLTISIVFAFKISLQISAITYLAAAIYVTWRHQRTLPIQDKVYSFNKNTWLNLLLLCLTLVWGWPLIIQFFARFVGGPTTDAIGIAFNYLFFISFNAIFIYAIYLYSKRPPIVDHKKHTAINDATSPRRISITTLDAELKRCHKDANVTIETLAAHLNVTKSDLAYAIKQHFDKNFIDVINSYRINTAKNLLRDPKISHTSIIDILYMSGFNNVSSFYRYFKNDAGMAPKEFRRIHAQTTNQ